MAEYYTDERAVQVMIALLKEHGVRKVIASPGGTNVTFVASLQIDPYFEMYSCADERSAAYMACGLAAESGEPVVISCTGATASQNYTPGLIEAFYSKLPILAITSTQPVNCVGHHVAQVTDRSVLPNDTAKLSVALPVIKDDDDLWECEVKANKAILELTRHGGGPVHINLPTTYDPSYKTRELPPVRVINRILPFSDFPELPDGKIAVFVGAYAGMTQNQMDLMDRFCANNNAVVFCDHTSGYKGKYRVLFSLAARQKGLNISEYQPDVLIHIGEITGDYYGMRVAGRNTDVWRVNEDGEIRDTFRKLRYVFEMREADFFAHYAEPQKTADDSCLEKCSAMLDELRGNIPELPFSNPWVASQMAPRIPEKAVIHFGILNSLRSWNYFELPRSVRSTSNVGGFGIDGCVSSLLGASLADPQRLYFGVVGDLAFFYDMNSIGNRHVGRNLRIVLVNNGKGTEFKRHDHIASAHGDHTNEYISAARHFGSQSKSLVRHYAQDLGFEYLCASNKQEFNEVCERFLDDQLTESPMLFEIFTDSNDESDALDLIANILKEPVGSKAKNVAKTAARTAVKKTLGETGIRVLKKALGK